MMLYGGMYQLLEVLATFLTILWEVLEELIKQFRTNLIIKLLYKNNNLKEIQVFKQHQRSSRLWLYRSALIRKPQRKKVQGQIQML